jgi:prefoldin subunit 5
MTPEMRAGLESIAERARMLRQIIAALVAQIELLRAENAQLRRDLGGAP